MGVGITYQSTDRNRNYCPEKGARILKGPKNQGGGLCTKIRGAKIRGAKIRGVKIKGAQKSKGIRYIGR